MPTSKPTPSGDTAAGNEKHAPSGPNGVRRRDRLLKLFLSTLYLSAFTFGGGYVIVSLLKTKFVDELHWIKEDEMMDLVAIAQSSPGAIAVNGAIVIGFRLCGIPGILCAVLGAILPPFIILTVISSFYTLVKDSFIIAALLEGMSAGVCAVICSVVFDMASGILKDRDPLRIAIMLAAFIACYVCAVNVVIVILATALAGLVITLLRERRARA